MKAVIDIGSNSVRLLNVNENKKTVITTMLAKNMRDGFLDVESIERTVSGISQLLSLAPDCEGGISIFATEAVRAAKNRTLFLDCLKQVTPLPVDILSGDEEATISFLGASEDVKGTVGVIDIGGASVEYAYGTYGNILYKNSLPIGAVALKNKFGDDKTQIENHLKYQVKGFDNSFVPNTLIGVSGTLSSLVAMDLELEVYDPSRVHKHKLTMAKLLTLENIIYSSNNLTSRYKTLKARAEIIKQGISIIVTLMKHLNLEEITISEKDNLEGYILHKKLQN